MFGCLGFVVRVWVCLLVQGTRGQEVARYIGVGAKVESASCRSDFAPVVCVLLHLTLTVEKSIAERQVATVLGL